MMGTIAKNTKMNYLSFACILIKAEMFDKLGMLDEGLLFYHEDCEYGIRAGKSGYDITYVVDSKIIHLGGTSSSNSSMFAFENDIKGLLHIYKKHYSDNELKALSRAIRWSMNWRIIFWQLGFYRSLIKIGLYSRPEKSGKDGQGKLLAKYKELRKLTRGFK
jgi:GT2 family glycosyltransferase